MITRRRFLVASATVSLASAFPALATTPTQLTKDEIEQIDESFLHGLASKLFYETSGGWDCYGGEIDFGIRSVRIGDQVVLWLFTKNQEMGFEDDTRKLVFPLVDAAEEVGNLYWRFDFGEDEISEPNIAYEDIEALPDMSGAIVAHKQAIEGDGRVS
jgi:hypothetical protein